MNFLKSVFAVLLLTLVIGSCSKNANTTLSPEALDSLKMTFQSINHQMDQVWTEMIMDDDGKLENMRRILQEVTYSGNYNRLKLDSLSREIENLAKIRYDRHTMSDSDLITLYDSLTTQTMGELTTFTTSLPQFQQFPLMETLLQEIFEADDRVLHYRIEYDNAAKWFNLFVEDNRPYLDQITSQSDLQPKPLFELPE